MLDLKSIATSLALLGSATLVGCGARAAAPDPVTPNSPSVALFPQGPATTEAAPVDERPASPGNGEAATLAPTPPPATAEAAPAKVAPAPSKTATAVRKKKAGAKKQGAEAGCGEGSCG